jgi:hypothetical protein
VTAPTSRAGLEAEATPLNSLSALAVGGNQPPGKNDPPLMTAEAIVGLSSLASIREIILYLRQSGEVFAEHETADELLARANLRRIEQALPPFALLPTSLPKVVRQDKPEKVTLPRPLSVRTRADWAGLVVTSPAE